MHIARWFLGLALMSWSVVIVYQAQAQEDLFQPADKAQSQKGGGRSFDAVAQYEAFFEPSQVAPGHQAAWKFRLRLAPGWHTYPTHQADINAEPYVSEFQVVDAGGLQPGTLREPPPRSKPEPALKITQLQYYEGEVVWEWPFHVPDGIAAAETKVTVQVRLQVCDDRGCLPPRTLKLTTPLKIAGGKGPTSHPQPKEQLLDHQVPGSESNALRGAELDAEYAEILARLQGHDSVGIGSNSDLTVFLLAGVLWGALSLITPCVFPMIPITVSYFLKQSERAHYRPWTMASVYCLTIVVVLALAAVTLLEFFRNLSVHPLMNLVLGGLFVFFALSLLGMYEIRLPSSLARFTSSQESHGGLYGTVFMALTFTIISFTCVAPFLGGFAGTAVQSRPLWQQILGGLAFAATFASPFFILALFPTLLRRLPRSGSWMNAVKVVMGFLELAAAFKFFRMTELVLLPEPVFLTYDLVLGTWIALSLLCGAYLLGLYRLPHDTPLEHVSVPRMLFGLTFLSLGFYLLPGLFPGSVEGTKWRPKGAVFAWIDAFLLPDPGSSQSDLPWTGRLKTALDEARLQNRPVFVDFTGETCTNCRYNEQTVFTRGDVRDLLRRYVLVQLYTDKVPLALYPPGMRAQVARDSRRPRADAEAHLRFQRNAFGTEQLPLYVIMRPLPDGTIRVVGVYDEGKINDLQAFIQFLQNGLG